MDNLVMTMVVELPLHYSRYDVGDAVMRGAESCCQELWIDGNPVPITKNLSLRTDKPVHALKYVFAPGVDYIPERAFADMPSSIIIRSITLPEGLKRLKNSCFYHCHFEGNLILPDSLDRICADALDCKVDGVFHLPNTVKYISSLPKSEDGKAEIILPEGMLGFTPERIITDHLHIPSTLRECHPRDYSRSWDVHRITIAPGNPYLIIRDDELVSLIEEKKEKLKKMDELSWNALLDQAFEGSGLERHQQYDGKTLYVKLTENEGISFRLGGKMTSAKAEQAFYIASRFHSLINNTFSGKKDHLRLNRYYTVPQRKCLFTQVFNNGIVNIEISVTGGKEEMWETFILSQRFFSCVCHLISDIEKKYGHNHLHFNIIH